MESMAIMWSSVNSPAPCPALPKPPRISPDLMVEYPQHLVAGVDDVHVLLLGVGRERDIERRADRVAAGRPVRRGRIGGAGLHGDDSFQDARLVEDFDPVVAAVADIEQARRGRISRNADVRRRSARTGRGPRPRRPTGAETCLSHRTPRRGGCRIRPRYRYRRWPDRRRCRRAR